MRHTIFFKSCTKKCTNSCTKGGNAWMPSRSCAHLVSLSSPSSVEGQTLWLRSGHLTSWGATIKSAPTNRQLADALTKDATDPVDMLRSCMRGGEYQPSPEHTILERAAAERSRRRQRQVHHRVSRPSHQLLSWLNKGSVSF